MTKPSSWKITIIDTFIFKINSGSVVIVPGTLTVPVSWQLILGATSRGLHRTATQKRYIIPAGVCEACSRGQTHGWACSGDKRFWVRLKKKKKNTLSARTNALSNLRARSRPLAPRADVSVCIWSVTRTQLRFNVTCCGRRTHFTDGEHAGQR